MFRSCTHNKKKNDELALLAIVHHRGMAPFSFTVIPPLNYFYYI